MSYAATPKYNLLDLTKPADTELISNLPAAIRQNRRVAEDFLDVFFDLSTGLPSAGLITNTMLAGNIAGDKLGAGAIDTTQLANSAVETLQLNDRGVTGPKIALLALLDEHIAAGAISGLKLTDLTLTGGKMVAKTVTGTQIANDSGSDSARAIDSDHIKDNAIKLRHLASTIIDSTKITMGANANRTPKLMIGGAAVEVLPITGAIKMVVDPGVSIVTSLADGGVAASTLYQRLEQNVGVGTTLPSPSAASEAAGLNNRTRWANSPDSSIQLVSIHGHKLKFVRAGTFFFRGKFPCWGVGMHRAQMGFVEGGTIKYGTTADAPIISTIPTMSYSWLETVLTIIDEDRLVEIQHFTENAVTGWEGQPVSQPGAPEIYGVIELIELNSVTGD
ncbi:MAG: hypothetical protein COA57_14880 [Flavobacteriales bacterium]|nr:MAG: hypothetical protein COA57_14880 [Flavobacteriales bacterium]